MNDEVDQPSVIVLRAVEEVESRMADRENRRFRTLYVLAGIASFVGIGVIAQLVDFYATKAVEVRIEKSKQEYESAKAFAQLLALATKLDVSSSFSHTDREAIMRLLKAARDNRQLRSEPAFDALLEKILDSFTASNNASFVSVIFDDYSDECLRIPGMVETLLQHYARVVVGHADLAADVAKRDIARYELLANVAPSFALSGASAFFTTLMKHRLAGLKASPELEKLLDSYSALSNREARDFRRFFMQFSDPKKLGRRETPENLRISEVTQSYAAAYGKALKAILEARAPEKTSRDDDS